ncbi:MAG TPA: rRNA maturation RNase YbeY [Gemmatirosa sp.]|jgi:rRNA maturation RNase YbeY|nr:rRNA maturation RNase YbeY [Gemmatirosa sp.]
MTGAGDSRPRRGARATGALTVDVTAGGVRVPLARASVSALAREVLRAEGVRQAEISLTFVDRPTIAALNWRHLRHRGPTDIITFELGRVADDAPVIGDVYIAPEVAREQAREHGVPVREELARLVVHGMLHVLGQEHPDGEERVGSPMWAAQERHVRRLRRLWSAPARTTGVAR